MTAPQVDHTLAHINARKLPATYEELNIKSMRARTINDEVHDLFKEVFNANPTFRALLEATSNPEAVEGSTMADDFEAARLLRQAAPDNSRVKKANLVTIRKALIVVLRRHEISRKDRARLLGGEVVADI